MTNDDSNEICCAVCWFIYMLSLSLFLSLSIFSLIYRLCWIFLDDEGEREEKNREGSPSMICLRTSSCDDGYCETQFASNIYTILRH